MCFDDDDGPDDRFAMLKRLIFESVDFGTIVGMTDKGRTMARVYFELAERLSELLMLVGMVIRPTPDAPTRSRIWVSACSMASRTRLSVSDLARF